MTVPTQKISATSIKEAQATIQSAIQSLTAQAEEKQALIDGYRAEVHALNRACISFEDYADYVRQDMRESGSKILDGFNENILSNSGGRVAKNKVSLSDFESGVGVFQDTSTPISIEGATHWKMLCFLGGKAFEDAIIERLRVTYATRWGNEHAMSVAQRRVRLEELGQLIDQEQAAKLAIDTELEALLV